MKLSLALFCLLNGASAFLMQPSSNTPLTRTFSYLGSLDGKGDSSKAAASTSEKAAPTESRTQALEARLMATQKALETRLKSLETTDKPATAPKAATSEPGGAPKKTSDRLVTVQGGSLKTWTFNSPSVERVQVVLGTEGRPLEADVGLWQGPDNTPQKIRIYVEDGSLRPFNAYIETPRGPNTIAIRNTAHLEFPLAAKVIASVADDGPAPSAVDASTRKTIQGGALRTYPFDPSVESVQVLLRTDGRPLNSRIELLQGPNNNKQVLEIYTEDGMDRPFFVVIETPGSGNVVRVVNTATVEFPLSAWVEPHRVGTQVAATEAVIGGDQDGGFMPDREWFSNDREW